MMTIKLPKGLVGIGVAILVLSGCAAKPSVSEYQCMAGDWQSIGYRDGSQGLARSQVLKHAEACGEYGVVPDRPSYVAGWQEGIAEFCTPQNGFDLGERGRGLNRQCKDSAFSNAYYEGRELYQARREVQQLASSLNAAEHRLETIDTDIVEATAAQLLPDLTAQERLALAADLKALVEERARLRDEVPALAYDLSASQARLDELERVQPQFSMR